MIFFSFIFGLATFILVISGCLSFLVLLKRGVTVIDFKVSDETQSSAFEQTEEDFDRREKNVKADFLRSRKKVRKKTRPIRSDISYFGNVGISVGTKTPRLDSYFIRQMPQIRSAAQFSRRQFPPDHLRSAATDARRWKSGQRSHSGSVAIFKAWAYETRLNVLQVSNIARS